MEKPLENMMEKAVWRRGGFVMIFFLILFAFIFVPHMLKHEHSFIFSQCVFFALMLAVVYSIKSSTLIFAIELGCALPFLVFDLLSLYQQSLVYMLIAYAFAVPFLLVAIYDFTRNILTYPHITANLIFAALIVYVLVGIFWAKLYFLENALVPGSFHSFQHMLNFNEVTFEEAFNLHFNLIYYSFSVLTTLGIGDIIPLHNQAKALTISEAVCGQLFFGIIISKLVASWHQSFLAIGHLSGSQVGEKDIKKF